jgi:hypothetical protein
MEDECERIWKEAVLFYSRIFLQFLEGLRKTIEDISQDRRSPGQDSNQASL